MKRISIIMGIVYPILTGFLTILLYFEFNKPSPLAVGAVYGYPEIRDSLVSLYKIPHQKATILSFYIGFNCDRYRVPWKEAAALVKPESNFDPYALSYRGAIGYFQIMPETGMYLAHELGEPYPDTFALYNPELNIKLGIYYIAKLKLALDGNYEKAAKAYNIGIGNYWAGVALTDAEVYWQSILKEYGRLCGQK